MIKLSWISWQLGGSWFRFRAKSIWCDTFIQFCKLIRFSAHYQTTFGLKALYTTSTWVLLGLLQLFSWKMPAAEVDKSTLIAPYYIRRQTNRQCLQMPACSATQWHASQFPKHMHAYVSCNFNDVTSSIFKKSVKSTSFVLPGFDYLWLWQRKKAQLKGMKLIRDSQLKRGAKRCFLITCFITIKDSWQQRGYHIYNWGLAIVVSGNIFELASHLESLK